MTTGMISLTENLFHIKLKIITQTIFSIDFHYEFYHDEAEVIRNWDQKIQQVLL